MPLLDIYNGLATVPLHRLAYSRAEDKGNRLNLSLFAYHPETYTILVEQVTETRVNALFAHRGATNVRCYPRWQA